MAGSLSDGQVRMRLVEAMALPRIPIFELTFSSISTHAPPRCTDASVPAPDSQSQVVRGCKHGSVGLLHVKRREGVEPV